MVFGTGFPSDESASAIAQAAMAGQGAMVGRPLDLGRGKGANRGCGGLGQSSLRDSDGFMAGFFPRAEAARLPSRGRAATAGRASARRIGIIGKNSFPGLTRPLNGTSFRSRFWQAAMAVRPGGGRMARVIRGSLT